MSTKVNVGDEVALQFIVDRLHVSVSDEDVEADIRARAAKSTMAAPRQYVDALVKHALLLHHANQTLYAKVNRGF